MNLTSARATTRSTTRQCCYPTRLGIRAIIVASLITGWAGAQTTAPTAPSTGTAPPAAYPTQPAPPATYAAQPGAPGANPAQPGAPAAYQAQPGAPGAYPAQPGAYPAQPGAYPAQPGAAPPPGGYPPGATPAPTYGYAAQPQAAQPPYAAPMPPAAQTGNDPSSAESSRAPSTGLALTITGAVLTGVGVVNLAFTAMCSDSSFYPTESDRDTCKTLSLVAGGAFIGVGVPLFIIGMVQRSKYKEWKASHSQTATLVPRLQLGAPNSNFGLTLASSF